MAKKKVSYGIFQTELGTYRAMHADAKRLQAELDSRRKSLMERIDAGHMIEPGVLCAQISLREVRRLTKDEVRRLLGPDVLAELETQLKPVVERLFSVVESPVAMEASA